MDYRRSLTQKLFSSVSVSLSTAFQSDSVQMFVRKRLYLLLLFNLGLRAVTESRLGLRAVGTKK